MTVAVNDTVERLTISGTGPYTFDFRIFAKSDLTIRAITGGTVTLLTLDTDYTIPDDSVDAEDGGTVSLTSAAASTYSGRTLDIRANTPIAQSEDLENQGSFRLAAIETALDRHTRQLQDVRRLVNSCLRLQDVGVADAELTPIGNWLSKIIGISSGGIPEPVAGLSNVTLSQSVIAGLLTPQTTAESNAGVTPTNMAYVPGHLRRYGGLVNGVANDAVAWQQALDQSAQSGGAPVTWSGDSYIASSLQLRNNASIRGNGRSLSNLSYGGSAQAFVNVIPGTRIYNVAMRDFRLVDVGTGTVGLDLDSISEGHFDHLIISGFTTNVRVYSPTSGYAVYNRFYNVKSHNCTTAYLITGISSNATTIIACRADISTTGIKIDDSNECHIAACQIENCTTGIALTGSVPGRNNSNTITHNRFENNTEDWNVGTNVSDTVFLMNYYVDLDFGFTDNGTRTVRMEGTGNSSSWKLLSAIAPDTNGTSWTWERTSNGGTGANPAMIVRDSATSSGTPVTLQIETERGGTFLRGEKGGTAYFDVTTAGEGRYAGGLVAGANAAIAASAAMEVRSTAGGFLLPRMTTTQRDAISSPAEGLTIYNTSTHKINVRVAAAWEAVTSA